MTDPEARQWESYLYPGTDILRNKFGLTDFRQLRSAEYRVTGVREAEIRGGLVNIPQTFDATHLKALHAHIFQDVYDWAGEYRTVNLGKPGSEPFAASSNIDLYLNVAARTASRQDWPNLGQRQAGYAAAEVVAGIVPDVGAVADLHRRASR
ncbi:hypothetical protein EH165_14640 [Nakamurella antarctica]|uniref:protein adenylyltransferase n=1 Tax=Nakamurella antarctica TaxID=1902245 RepID=A0A3G8ZXQ0_9ACTN|nr:hypothetical protein EH165_14640 [Nakamurella antarctica]